MVLQPQAEPRISLAGRRELNAFEHRFRCMLRAAALELLADAGDFGPIGPDAILQAVPIACERLVAGLGAGGGEERGTYGSTREAA
jgi:hypothetical protein